MYWKILNKYHDHLPLDPRTLLKYSKNLNILQHSVEPGYYVHYGIKNGIISIIKNIPVDIALSFSSLSIQANIDGLPLHQSTVKGFWPILVQIITLPNSPVFTVGLYYGEKKPLSSNDFLADFVRELVELLAHGLDYQNHHFNIIFQIFCCDTPAQAFIKNI